MEHRRANAPFRVSDSARNFPPSISLSSGGAFGLSADTGPSAVIAAVRHAGTAHSLPLKHTEGPPLYMRKHMT